MPAKKPRATKIVQGTFQKCRNPENEPEPTVEIEARKPPAHLNKYAKGFWNEVVKEMIETGVLTVVDWAAFELCCVAYGLYRESKDAIYSYFDYGGGRHKRTLAEYLAGRNSQTSPELTAMNKAMEQFLKYSNALGLNPVARNRIDLKPKEKGETDPVEDMWNEAAK